MKRDPARISTRSDEFLLMLEIFDTIRDPRRCYTLREIAAACGVGFGTLAFLEKQALHKLQHAAKSRHLTPALLQP